MCSTKSENQGIILKKVWESQEISSGLIGGNPVHCLEKKNDSRPPILSFGKSAKILKAALSKSKLFIVGGSSGVYTL